MYICFAAIVMIFLNGCGPKIDETLDIEKLVDEGWNLYEGGELAEATKKFDRVLLEDEQNLKALVGLGWCELGQQNAQSAVTKFRKAIMGDAELLEAHVGLAGGLLATQNYLSAIESSNKVLSKNPDYIFPHNPNITSKNLHLVIAESYYYLDDYQNSFSELQSLDPTVNLDPASRDPDLLLAKLEEFTQSIGGI